MQAMGWKLAPGTLSLDVVYLQPGVMEAFQKQLMTEQKGPLTHISSTQGFLPYKVRSLRGHPQRCFKPYANQEQLFATEAEQKEVIASVEKSMPNLTPFQRKQYERTLEHLKDDKSANVQVILVPASANFDVGTADQSQLFPPPTPEQGMGVIAASCLAYPLSRGTIHIKSADPKEHPEIDPAFMSHPADAAVCAAGLKVSIFDSLSNIVRYTDDMIRCLKRPARQIISPTSSPVAITQSLKSI